MKTKTWTRRIAARFYAVYRGTDTGGQFIVGGRIGKVYRDDESGSSLPWAAQDPDHEITHHRTRAEAIAAVAERVEE